MDRQTLVNYGWIVVVALVVAVMLALATPFGSYVMDGVSAIASGYINATNNAMSDDNKDKLVQQWEDKWLDSVCKHESQSVGMKEATCTEDGLEGKVICNDCQVVLNEGTIIPAHGHNITIINATNRYTGDEYCADCDAIITHGEDIEPTILQCKIGGTSYSFEDGMTWNEWLESDYNTGGYKIKTYGSSSYITKSGSRVLTFSSYCQLKTRISKKSELNSDTVLVTTPPKITASSKMLPVSYSESLYADEGPGFYLDVSTPIGYAKTVGYAFLLNDNKYEVIYLS